MIEIRLERESWLYNQDLPLGPPGGFGAVFAGKASDGRPVAVKRLNLDAGISAHRELRIASELAGRVMEHVIPIFDSGEDPQSGRYYVVMAIADKSLEADLNSKRVFSQEDAINVLLQASKGIAELNGLVHRDMKPGNILNHEGKWKIADFGIARFVEESTSLHTLKHCLSPQYAAPEQWLYQTAQVATDLYALGCIGYRLLSGHLPYPGPTSDDFCNQHLSGTAPALPETIHPRLRTLLSMLLRKHPQARPSLSRFRELLADIGAVAPGSRPNSVAEVAARLEHAQAKEDASRASQKAADDSRGELAKCGRLTLSDLVRKLRTKIVREAPSTKHDDSTFLTLGQARISLPTQGDFSFLPIVPPQSFPKSKYDVVLVIRFEIYQLHPLYVWSTSLLFCRLPHDQEYRWHEVSFMETYRATKTAPFDLSAENSDAPYRYYHIDSALSYSMHKYQPAFGPVSIDDENEEEFIDR